MKYTGRHGLELGARTETQSGRVSREVRLKQKTCHDIYYVFKGCLCVE